MVDLQNQNLARNGRQPLSMDFVRKNMGPSKYGAIHLLFDGPGEFRDSFSRVLEFHRKHRVREWRSLSDSGDIGG